MNIFIFQVHGYTNLMKYLLGWCNMIKKKDGCLVVISGPSGAGKDTICAELLKRHKEMYLSISMTTRNIRGSEVNGKDYYFVSEEEFIKNINNNNFIEYAKVYDKYYGTPKSEVENRLKQGIDVLLVIIFIMPPDLTTLIKRLVKRNTSSKDAILERFKTDYKLINEYNKYNYVVVNDNIIDATNKVDAILLASKCSVDRIESLDLQTEEEIIHEILIS